jgi:ABC-type multidrug transport system ATPase subunit
VVVLSTHIVDVVSDVCQGMAILVGGRVWRQGEPQALLEELRGTVWRKAVTREELGAVSEAHLVLGTRWHGGRLVVHVVSADRPDVGFEPAAPDLQDLYFHTLKRGASAA